MLRITPEAWAKLELALSVMKEKMSNYEVHGFGKLEFIDGEPTMVDVDMPKQIAQSAHIDTKPEDLFEWRLERFQLRPNMTDEEIEEANDEIQSWRIWWHSHPGMTPTYSSTDTETLEDLANEAGGYFIGLCIDDKMKNTVYVCYSQPIPTGVLKYDKQAYLVRPHNPELEELYKRIEELEALPDVTEEVIPVMEKNVSKKVYTPQYPQAQYPSNHPTWQNSTRNFTPNTGGNGAINKKIDEDDGSFVKFIIDKEAKVLNRGCEVCMGMLIDGKEEWKKNSVITIKYGIPICIDCEMDEKNCLCLESDEEVWNYALGCGWISEIPEEVKAKLNEKHFNNPNQQQVENGKRNKRRNKKNKNRQNLTS